jgi:hypothetical protein
MCFVSIRQVSSPTSKLHSAKDEGDWKELSPPGGGLLG